MIPRFQSKIWYVSLSRTSCCKQNKCLWMLLTMGNIYCWTIWEGGGFLVCKGVNHWVAEKYSCNQTCRREVNKTHAQHHGKFRIPWFREDHASGGRNHRWVWGCRNWQVTSANTVGAFTSVLSQDSIQG